MDSHTSEYPKRKRGTEESEESMTVQRALSKTPRNHSRNHRPWRTVAHTTKHLTVHAAILGVTREADLRLIDDRWQATDPNLLAMGVSSTIRASAILKLAHALKRLCINEAAAHATIVNSPLKMRHSSQVAFWEE